MPEVWLVQFAPEAIDELERAREYYNLQRPGLGNEFIHEFELQIDQLSIHPFVYAVRYLDVRLAIIDRFPYAIHFVIREAFKTVVVQTVLSTFKNPDANWKER